MARVSWRYVGLGIQAISLASIVLAIVLIFNAVADAGRPDSDPHGYARLFGSFFGVVLLAIAATGSAGLIRSWRGRSDTVLLLYDTFVILFAVGSIPVAFEHAVEPGRFDAESVAGFLIVTQFTLLTGAAALAVLRARQHS